MDEHDLKYEMLRKDYDELRQLVRDQGEAISAIQRQMAVYRGTGIGVLFGGGAIGWFIAQWDHIRSMFR